MLAHRSRNVEKDSDGLLGRAGDDWLEIAEVDGLLHVFAAHIGAQKVKVGGFLVARENVKQVVGLSDVLVLAHKHSQLVVLGPEQQID